MIQNILFALFSTICAKVDLESDWSLKSDILNELNHDFDETGIYEKYISRNGMTQADYISYVGLKALVNHILMEYDDLVTLLDVPNGANGRDRASITMEYQ